VHLKSLTLKGFKSFPDRTHLDFGPGVSVVVGPNGSGKSNITDAVLWAMGEQSPLAVRGSSMQDVIFGGGRGVQARSCAEVEIVLENSDGSLALPFSEISILRRLHRSGEGEYRLNGARCRLGDVIEVLSDTGLGKETHSVISQGRVESIVLSKPRDRRLLIEEAAGLGKHRKRRRRAQLKLERTQENLDRALDVEREARSRLRPLKRQAEAAELHQRLERQMLEARLGLAREALRSRRLQLADAQDGAGAARAAREQVEASLQEVAGRRGEAERSLAQRSERHEALAGRAMRAGAAHERLELRREQAAAIAESLAARILRVEREIELLDEALAGGGVRRSAEEHPEGEHPTGESPAGERARREGSTDGEHTQGGQDADGDPPGTHSPEGWVGRHISALEGELADLEREREQELERELAELERDREHAAAEVAQLDAELADTREAREHADARAEEARAALREAERDVESARREAARVGGELAAVNQFLRNHASAIPRYPGGEEEPRAGVGGPRTSGGEEEPRAGGAGGPRTLSEALCVQPGYELALAAALGRRLDAALVPNLARAAALLDRAGSDGATALLADRQAPEPPAAEVAAQHAAGEDVGSAAADRAAGARPEGTLTPPAPGARPLLELVSAPAPVRALAERLLGDAWVVERLEDLPEDFSGIAVTPRGRVWFAASGEVRQVTEGGAERVLARRNERDQLILAAESAAAAEHSARAAAERAQADSRAADTAREGADGALREVGRHHARALEQERHAGWLIEQRRAAPQQGPLAVRRAQLEGELAAERRQAERLAREHAERLARLGRLRAQLAGDTALAPLAERLAVALHSVGEAIAERVAALRDELARDRAAGDEMAAELRACAAQEAEIQARLRAQGEAVTAAEVAAQRLRDHAAEAELELRTVREQLEMPAPASDPESQGSSEEGARTETVAHAAEGERAQGAPLQATAIEEDSEPLGEEQVQALTARLERLRRRREQLGPVNPLAKEEYAEALAHVEELEARRTDMETALRELRTVIRDTDRQIHETFNATFEAAARNFEELARDVFPGGGGRLRLVKDDHAPRPVLGGEPLPGDGASAAANEGDPEAAAELEEEASGGLDPAASQPSGGDPILQEEMLGVEIEITPAGKSTKRLSLLSGGEKSMTALAFLFAVFLARPCPFYILDEVEAALDDLNLERFLDLLRRYADRAQFIVITHQKRTMEAADWLYGVSMAGNGVSKVLTRRLPPAEQSPESAAVQNGAALVSDESSAHETQSAPPVELPRPDMAEVA
jgi:chromosome segregation protein